MAENLQPTTPEKSGHNQSAANNPTDKKAAKPKNKLRPANRNPRKTTGLTKLEWGGFFVDLYVTLWVWSDLIVCHDIKRLVFLLAAVLVAHGVLCYFISKFFNSWRWSLVVWFILSIVAARVSYKNCQQLPDVQTTTPKSPFHLLSTSPEPTKPKIEDEILYQSKIAQAHQWQPPALPTNATKLSDGQVMALIKFGGLTQSWPVGSELSGVGNSVLFPAGKVFIPYVKNNRIYVKTQTMFGDAEQTVQMNNEWPVNIPTGWDRNFNPSSFEIVDDTMLPVLQVRYDSANQIEIYGIFVSPNGGVTVAFGNSTYSASPGLGIPKIPDRKAWFKYPSTNHLGELAQ